MTKYVKIIPEVVEAFQYDGDFMNRDGVYYVPEWAVDALETGVLRYDEEEPWELNIFYFDDSYAKRVNVGDYIIRRGYKISSMSKDDFEEKYAKVTPKPNQTLVGGGVNDTHVYCTKCKHLKIDLSQDFPFVCDFELGCNIWEPEDSRPFSERPFYEEGSNDL